MATGMSQGKPGFWAPPHSRSHLTARHQFAFQADCPISLGASRETKYPLTGLGFIHRRGDLINNVLPVFRRAQIENLARPAQAHIMAIGLQ